jgi:hypothetical protein
MPAPACQTGREEEHRARRWSVRTALTCDDDESRQIDGGLGRTKRSFHATIAERS